MECRRREWLALPPAALPATVTTPMTDQHEADTGRGDQQRCTQRHQELARALCWQQEMTVVGELESRCVRLNGLVAGHHHRRGSDRCRCRY